MRDWSLAKFGKYSQNSSPARPSQGPGLLTEHEARTSRSPCIVLQPSARWRLPWAATRSISGSSTMLHTRCSSGLTVRFASSALRSLPASPSMGNLAPPTPPTFLRALTARHAARALSMRAPPLRAAAPQPSRWFDAAVEAFTALPRSVVRRVDHPPAACNARWRTVSGH